MNQHKNGARTGVYQINKKKEEEENVRIVNKKGNTEKGAKKYELNKKWARFSIRERGAK